MPKRYFCVESEITVPDIISAHGGKILVRGGDPQPLDGVLPHRRRVIVEFDSPEAVKTFYHSDAYQAVLPIRIKASKGFVCLLVSYRKLAGFQQYSIRSSQLWAGYLPRRSSLWGR